MLKRQHVVSWIIANSMIGLKHHYPSSNISSSNESSGSRSGGAVEHFINALLSKFVATLITYPMQLLQTRQRWSSSSSSKAQQQEEDSQPSPPPQDDDGNTPKKTVVVPKSKQRWSLVATVLAIVQDLKRIIQQQGILGLYRGLESKLVQTCLNSALMFVAYEKLVELLTKLLHHKK
jgi:adenine nucleotide transporter 17